MSEFIIPANYQQWRHCITEICRIPLTSEYIDQRLKSLTNPKDHTTQQFIQLYGEQQRQMTLQWFAKAKSEVGQ